MKESYFMDCFVYSTVYNKWKNLRKVNQPICCETSDFIIDISNLSLRSNI